MDTGTLITVSAVIGLVLTGVGVVIGFVGLFFQIRDTYFPLDLKKCLPKRRLSWRLAQKGARVISDQLISDGFSPSLILGIGRGGAIFGSLISGCLGHRPLVVIDRDYKWEKGRRLENLIFSTTIPPEFLTDVLLVAGEVHHGNTMKRYLDYLREKGAIRVKTATFFSEKDASLIVDYKGFESSSKYLKMPWMFTRDYIRADRHPPMDEHHEDGIADT